MENRIRNRKSSNTNSRHHSKRCRRRRRIHEYISPEHDEDLDLPLATNKRDATAKAKDSMHHDSPTSDGQRSSNSVEKIGFNSQLRDIRKTKRGLTGRRSALVSSRLLQFFESVNRLLMTIVTIAISRILFKLCDCHDFSVLRPMGLMTFVAIAY